MKTVMMFWIPKNRGDFSSDEQLNKSKKKKNCLITQPVNPHEKSFCEHQYSKISRETPQGPQNSNICYFPGVIRALFNAPVHSPPLNAYTTY
jgi:hypothetical protein